jgi:putative pyruvate formate lyase activating enzyme
VRGAGRRILVRHLLMPGHLDCCTRPVLQWLAQWPDLQVSLLAQYLAPAHAKGELAATLAPDEIDAAYALARQLGLRLVD